MVVFTTNILERWGVVCPWLGFAEQDPRLGSLLGRCGYGHHLPNLCPGCCKPQPPSPSQSHSQWMAQEDSSAMPSDRISEWGLQQSDPHCWGLGSWVSSLVSLFPLEGLRLRGDLSAWYCAGLGDRPYGQHGAILLPSIAVCLGLCGAQGASATVQCCGILSVVPCS